jgi:pyruvate carboxylase
VRVFFELNGQPRTIRVPNRKAGAGQAKRPKAEPGNPNHVGAPMPGVVAHGVAVRPARRSRQGDLLLTIEAMKMEPACTPSATPWSRPCMSAPGGQIDAKDLLVDPGETVTFGVASGTGQPISEEFYAIDDVNFVAG